ncbi:hypothetical protein [Sphingobacterium yanglingense]|nr:hypothetical protein [Sphingobacterium yanglingense]
MRSLKNNWLSAGITLLFLLGAFFVVRAMEKKEIKETIPKSKQPVQKAEVLYTFEYKGPDFSKANVENEANWVYTPNTELCEGSEEIPCRIQVSQSYVDNPTTSPTLKSMTNITADLNPISNTHFVDGIADASGVISNRAL